MSDEEQPPPPPKRADPLERIVTAVSALIVLAIIAYLLNDARRPDTPAAFEVRPKQVRAAAGSYEVPIGVRNLGDEAAKDVMIHVELVGPDSTMGESDLTIDWLPGRSEHEATAVFREDPRRFRLTAEVTGYNSP